MELLMGLDLGSTNIKAIIYTKDGKPVSESSNRLPLTFNNPDHPTWCVWKHDDVWNIAKKAIGESVKKLAPGDTVKALAVTGFGMDGLPLDRDGKELYDLISWQCPRTVEQYEELKDYYMQEEVLKDSFRCTPMVIDSVNNIKWMEKYEPSVLEKADKWLLIEDYVNYKLCGVKATDYSMASTTSLFKLDTLEWSDRIMNDLGVKKSLMPPVMQSGTVLGKVLPEVAAEIGISSDTLVVLGGHDYIAATFAAGVKPGEIFDITGTWEMLIGVTRDLSKISMADLFYIEPHVAKNAWCLIESSISGSMYEWIVDHLGGNWDWVMSEAGSSKAGANGCTFLPHFAGAVAPRTEPTSLGAFIGLNNSVDRGDMARAVIEGLNYKAREMLEGIQRAMAYEVKEIKAEGGAAKNQLWMQIKADILGVPVLVPDLYEATPLGAAMLAGLGTSVYESEEEAVESVTGESVVFEPQNNEHEIYSDLYENIYLKLQDSLSEVNREVFNRFVK
jgi:xylulokinase